MIALPGEQTFAEGYHNALDQGIDSIDLLDAVWECPHGRMPGYKGLACNCWAVLAPVIQLPLPLAFKEAA